MLIRAGFRIALRAEAETPLLCALSPHPEAPRPVLGSAAVVADPAVVVTIHRDPFGNRISRLVAPAGGVTLASDFLVEHSGRPDEVDPRARQHPVEDLPPEALPFLLPSRFCEMDALVAEAWTRFGATEPGWARVQAVCDFVHRHIAFGYAQGRPDKTAAQALAEGAGVCRDYAHLAIALCRALNIPARYASGWLGDIGVPCGGPMDFCAWFEVFLGGRWRTFDARYNTPRIGRILIARGRDAADAALITAFGRHELATFEVWCDAVSPDLDVDALAALLRPRAGDPPAPAREPAFG